MLASILEVIFEFLVEILSQIFMEVLVELGCESIANAFQPRQAANPFLAGVGLLFLGAILGLLTVWIFPDRLLHSDLMPGISLVLAPLSTGSVMHLFGNWRRRRGGKPTCLATFWGGVCFAFGLALVRWLMVVKG